MFVFLWNLFRLFFRSFFGNLGVLIVVVAVSFFSETFRWFFLSFLELFWEFLFYFLYLLVLSLHKYFLEYVNFAFSQFDVLFNMFFSMGEGGVFIRAAVDFFRLREFLAFAIPIYMFSKLYRFAVFRPPI